MLAGGMAEHWRSGKRVLAWLLGWRPGTWRDVQVLVRILHEPRMFLLLAVPTEEEDPGTSWPDGRLWKLWSGDSQLT